jgi:phospholipase/carboxylesterase
MITRVRLLLFLCVVTAGAACSSKPISASTTTGEIAGVRYLERMTGGAQPDERVPMIIVLHPMGGDPADMLPMFQRYPGRARLILPYGQPNGGKWLWYESVREDVAASVVTPETDRLASAISALTAARPTVGKPIVTGFSQGGIMTFALAVTHPEEMSAAFPLSGSLPKSLFASIRSGARPPIIAFHGGADLAVPTASALEAIAELKRAGYAAEIREFAGLEHEISDQELSELFERIEKVAN